jgi:pimeloyl-ACP methyl ester carboxylesterase
LSSCSPLAVLTACPAPPSTSTPPDPPPAPVPLPEWAGCRADVITAYGESLAQYNTSNAAHDVGLAISAIHQDAQPVFVLGISYGTYWAMRYQQLFPHQAAGVILDSIAPPGLSLLRQDEDTNLAAIDFFAACDADEFCASKLGPDSFAVASALMTKLKAGHCAAVAVPDAPTHVLLRRAMGGLLMDPGAREIIPSMVYRYDRCGERDLAPLTRLTRGLTNGGAPSLDNELWSFVLTHNVLFSEFREDPMPTAAALDAIREASVASRDVTTLFELNLDWPAYPLDEFVGGYATTDTPMLMLQGGLDSATLLQKARVVEAQFTGEHQHWVELPTAGHTTLFSSPFVDESGERRSCGVRLLMAFIADPTAALDTSCVDAIEPLDFSGRNLSLNRNFYGVDDAWE